MIPIRLALFLFGCLILSFFVLGNPRETELNLLFWSGQFRVYEIIVGSVLFGAILALLIRSHIGWLMKDTSHRNELELQSKKPKRQLQKPPSSIFWAKKQR